MTLFALGAPVVPAARTLPGELMRGGWWRIVREGDDYLFCFLSAGLSGREERIRLREYEARAIMAGQVDAEHWIAPA